MTDRLAFIDQQAEYGLIAREPTDAGLRVRLRDTEAVERRTRELIAAESSCCSFLTFSLDRIEGELVLGISGPNDARPVIDLFFAPGSPSHLVRAGSRIGGTGLPGGSLGPVVGASDGVPHERGLGLDVGLPVREQEMCDRTLELGVVAGAGWVGSQVVAVKKVELLGEARLSLVQDWLAYQEV